MSVFYLILAQFVTGINITGSKFLVSHLSIVALLETRFVVGTLILSFFLLCTRTKKRDSHSQEMIKPRLDGKQWGMLVAQALCAGMAFNLLMLAGIRLTSASIAGLVTSTLPAMIIVLTFLIFKQRITRVKLLCILFATIGLLVVNASGFTQESVSWMALLGACIVFIAMVPESLYYVLCKAVDIPMSAAKKAWWMNVINAIAMLPLLYVVDWPSLMALNSLDLLILFLVSLASALFYLFWFKGAGGVSASTAGLLTAFMPISTLLLSYLFLHEKITLIQMIGSLLILISIIFGSRKS
ncbi:MAG: DMT family transporter [Francisellaceae bacterium]